MRLEALSRRQFVVGAGASSAALLAGCGRLPWQAQPPAKVVRIGILGPSYASQTVSSESFQQGLRDLGYVEGDNVIIEARPAQGHPESYPALAADLVALPVDVIFAAGGTPAIIAASQVTTTIPIVVPVGDLLRLGLAASLARPRGNVTGLLTMATGLSGKRLELLHEAVPSVSRVAVLWNPENASAAVNLQETERAGRTLGLALLPLEVRDPGDFEGAFEAAREHTGAVFVLDDPLVFQYAQRIAELGARNRLPVVAGLREHAWAGSLMAYGPSLAAHSRRAAYYVDRILKGANPADLPLEQPMTFDFVVNMKTARELGITFPNEIMLQVTEVVQ